MSWGKKVVVVVVVVVDVGMNACGRDFISSRSFARSRDRPGVYSVNAMQKKVGPDRLHVPKSAFY